MPPSLPSPILVIDSASQEIVVGTGSAWARRADEAGIGVFTGAGDVLRLTGVALEQLGAIVFCEGPGSLLGVRIAAMAIRAWNATRAPGGEGPACFSYRSLELVAADLLDSGMIGVNEGFAVITDARRSAWNTLEVAADGAFSHMRRVPAGDLEAGGQPIFHPEGFARWQPLPARARGAAYRPERVLALARKFPLLRPCAEPEAFLIEAPEYRKTTTAHPSP